MKVRNVLEYGCPVWTGLISGVQKLALETVQRQSLSIILGTESKSYEKNMTRLSVPTLEERRISITKKFALKTLFSKRYSSSTFKLNPRFGDKSRVTQPRLLLPKTSTKRSEGAPFTFMATLLNDMSQDDFDTLYKEVFPPPKKSRPS